MIFNLNRLKPDKSSPQDVVIDRTTIYGNPYPVTRTRDREQAISLFGEYARKRIQNDPGFREGVKSLHGKRLFCWCAPLACHGEVLEALAAELNR